MSLLFLSHSSQDNAQAIALHNWLLKEGWDDIFLDLDPQRGIVAGERWERALHLMLTLRNYYYSVTSEDRLL